VPIITISRGSYSRGKEIAEKVSQQLGYDCIARDTLIEASEQFNIPEIKLIRAIHDAPSILERFGHSKEKYIAYIQAALLRYVKKDNVVYHGLAGHFLLPGISHVLKVRILSDWNDRIALEMEREGISRKEAERILKDDDEERRKWSKYLYGIDAAAPSLYDILIHIRHITVDDAVRIICNATRLPCFQATPEIQKALDNLHVASEVKVALMELKPDIEVNADDGDVLVKARINLAQEHTLVAKMKKIAEAIPGVKKVSIEAWR